MGTPSTGAFTKFAVDDSAVTQLSDFDGDSFAYELLGGTDLRLVTVNAFNDGIRGTRSRNKARVRQVQRRVTGGITMNPTPVELDQWFPRILGAAEVADAFALAETVPEFGVLIDRVAARYVYTGCKVSRCTISGRQGELISFRVDIEGKDEIESATAFPGTIPAIDGGAPYVFSDCTFALTADASAVEVQEFEITIDNVVSADRFMNSLTRNTIVALDRMVTVRLVVPFTADEIDLHDQAAGGQGGTLTLTNGGQSTLFTFGALDTPAETPSITGKDELTQTLNMTAYKSGSTPELAITHDSTA
jgi:hypothetical protein